MIRRYLSICLIAVSLVLGNWTAVMAAAPQVTADAFCLYDTNANQIIWGRSIHQMRPPASTTKMLTAILARGYCNFDDQITISEKADRTSGTSIGVKKGQIWRAEDLLKAALARSANDACVALAEYMAGSETLFGMLMTKKAVVIGARESNFVNASGLPSKYHYSSAYDLARIGTVLRHDPYLRKLVASPQVDINHPGYPQGLTLFNTNRLLLSYPGANGIKTGTTDAAGNCLVSSASRDGRNLIAVVLHSNDRYRDSRTLLDYGYQRTRLEKILSRREPYKYLRVQNGIKYKLTVKTADDVKLLMDKDNKTLMQQLVNLNYSPRARVLYGQHLGQLDIYYCGEKVITIPLVAAEEIPAQKKGIKQLLPWWH
ncbi:MAG: D-alanyl-D-alanine carboxypeptidase family protein [Methylocystaceae bacterium]